jgi:hypothetical protein
MPDAFYRVGFGEGRGYEREIPDAISFSAMLLSHVQSSSQNQSSEVPHAQHGDTARHFAPSWAARHCIAPNACGSPAFLAHFNGAIRLGPLPHRHRRSAITYMIVWHRQSTPAPGYSLYADTVTMTVTYYLPKRRHYVRNPTCSQSRFPT